MRIALLAADCENPWPNIGDSFITMSLERVLRRHEIIKVPLHRVPSEGTLAQLRAQDMVLIGGTNVVGVGGTVRSSFSLEDFESINRPIVPVGIGAQAKLASGVSIDRYGRKMLDFWQRSSAGVSVRDRLTQRCLDSVLGLGSTYLTGCPSLLLRGPSVDPNRRDWIFCPGPYWPGLSFAQQRRYQALTSRLLVKMMDGNRTICMLQQADGFYFHYPREALILFAPWNPEAHLDTVTGASAILSFRIHPVLVGVANGVPGLLVALDERTKSLAETAGIPYLTFNPDCSAAEVWRTFERSLDAFPWEGIRRKVVDLQSALVDYLGRHHLSVTPDRGTASPADACGSPLLMSRNDSARYRTPVLQLFASMIFKGLPMSLRVFYILERLVSRGLRRYSR